MSYVNIWIHLIWATKNRTPILTDAVRPRLFRHMHEYAREKNIHLDVINGHLNHVHALLSMMGDQSISKIAQFIKGESAHWANRQSFISGKLVWQAEYGAFSVSECMVKRVRAYIRKQEEHHRKKSFEEEYAEMMRMNGFSELVIKEKPRERPEMGVKPGGIRIDDKPPGSSRGLLNGT